ncbi:unnamed protein product [Trichogramma brassicae]|uniref:Uncharacterized protein n=1 Tax=Trichogramma brassicae TaxID=86971 RepID=A0A6H5HZL8_9HYME|nr:unnamed protein product [Trichogramma brassicae]
MPSARHGPNLLYTLRYIRMHRARDIDFQYSIDERLTASREPARFYEENNTLYFCACFDINFRIRRIVRYSCSLARARQKENAQLLDDFAGGPLEDLPLARTSCESKVCSGHVLHLRMYTERGAACNSIKTWWVVYYILYTSATAESAVCAADAAKTRAEYKKHPAFSSLKFLLLRMATRTTTLNSEEDIADANRTGC